MKTYNKKWIIYFLSAVILIVINDLIPQTTLNDRAIITALAIDIEEDEYVLNAQIIKPASTSGESKSTSYAVIEGKGSGLTEALTEISRKSGRSVLLSHCNLVILGKTILDTGYIYEIENLSTGWQLPEQSLVVGAQDKAVDVLYAHLTIENISSFHLLHTLTTNGTDVDTLNATANKFISEYGGKGATFVPKIMLIEKPRDSVDYTLVSEDVKLYEFEFDTGYGVLVNSPAVELSNEVCRGLNFLLYTIESGTFYLEHDQYVVELELMNKKTSTKYVIKDGIPSVTAEIKVEVKVKQIVAPNLKLSTQKLDTAAISEVEKKCAEQIEKECKMAYEFFLEKGVDALGFYDGMFKYNGLKWKNMENYVELSDITFNVKAEVEITGK